MHPRLRSNPRAVFSALAVFLSAAAALCAEQVTQNVPTYETIDSPKISVTVITNEWDGFGFLPVLVHVENNSDAAMSWRLNFQISAPRKRDKNELSLSVPVTLGAPARATRDTVLWLPGCRAGGEEEKTAVNMDVQGPGVHGGRWGSMLLNGWGNIDNPGIAVTPKLNADIRQMEFAFARTGRSASEAGAVAPEKDRLSIAEVNPAQWPADWRVWSPFATVLMRDDEYQQLDSPRQAALREWVALGGTLYLKPRHATRLRALEKRDTTRHGLGSIVEGNLPDTLLAHRNSARQAVAGAQWSRANPWRDTSPLLPDDSAEKWEPSRATIWLVLFLMVFGVLIGPLNLFVFAPAGKRHRLFFTVPVISLGASLLLVLVIVFYDGFGGAGMRRSLIVLLPGENKAVVAQQQLSRTGMLLGKKFPLPDDAVLAKIPADSEGAVSGKAVERAAGGARGDWFTSRSTQAHTLMRITPTRARVELVSGGQGSGPPVVQSSMPGTLRNFIFRSDRGTFWTVDELPPGKRVQLAEYTPSLSTHPSVSTHPVIVQAQRSPANGRFYAFAGKNEIAPLATLDSIDWLDDVTIVTGMLEERKTP